MAARSRLRRPILAALAFAVLSSPAFAQTVTSEPYASLFVVPGVDAGEIHAPQTAVTSLSAAAAAQPVPSASPLTPQRTSQQRLLPAMYVGFGALQAMDVHSTLRALDAGHVEQNPIMRWTTQHPVAFVSMKAAATAGTIYVANKIAKKHPKRALVFMGVINAVYAAVVFHNYNVPVR